MAIGKAAMIGALRVVLGAETGGLTRGLGQAESKIGRFSATLQRHALAASAAFATIAAAVAVAVKGAVNEADRLGKSAQKWGLAVEELSALKHAADLSGVSFEGLGTSLSRLSRNMSEVAAGARNEAANAFAALGVSVKDTDGKLKSNSQVMNEVADRFAQMRDGAGKTALAMALFGRSGQEMIPLLNAGSAGILRMTQEARELGIVIDTQTANAAQAFNDNLTRLGKVKDAIVMKVTAQMLPALEKLSAALVQLAKDTDFSASTAQALNTGMKLAVESGVVLSVVFARLAAEVRNLATVWAFLKAGEFSKALAAFREEGERTEQAIAKLRGTLETLWDAPPLPKQPAAGIEPPAIANLAELEKAQQRSLALAQQIDAQAASIMQRYLTPTQQMQAEVDKLNSAFARGIITQEEFAAASEVLAKRAMENHAIAAQTALETFAHVFGEFGKKNKALFNASKALSIAAAVISTYVGANKALEAYQPPLSFVMMAAVIAKGFANVAKIKAQAPAFQMGGSFTLPGGTGGADSVPFVGIGFPGERVTVERPRAAAGAVKVIELTGIRARDYYRGDVLRELVANLNDAMADGLVLKIRNR